ncbi:MAG: hypothetical protein CFH10_01296 [Alphaproteobacteria bacterium MarineAlpha4_Bin2]|nr:MAG: hypothetical protein CFH10_01296 [Alphaproteobacteria bacterium MarineAlpha4_Bin2]
MSDEHRTRTPTKGRAVIAWVVAPLVGIVFFPTVLLLAIGMAPSLVAFVIDKRPRKMAARSVAYLNFVGALPYALKLWTGQNSINGVMELVQEPAALLIMYSAAAAGWALNFVMAPIMSAYLAVEQEARARSIASRQEKLVKEWGAEVRGQSAIHLSPPQGSEQMSGDAGDSVHNDLTTSSDNAKTDAG